MLTTQNLIIRNKKKFHLVKPTSRISSFKVKRILNLALILLLFSPVKTPYFRLRREKLAKLVRRATHNQEMVNNPKALGIIKSKYVLYSIGYEIDRIH